MPEKSLVGQTIKHYEITERLGAGGMGEVYLATDAKLRRKVALKFLPREFADDPERRRRLEIEATSASSLDHPNIMTIYEIDECDGRPFIAMSYVEGMTLRETIDAGVTLEDAVRYGVQLAAALAAAHTQGIVHRDVKPANVIIGNDRRLRLADFGLARLKESSGITTEGSTVGTVGYMSPEQAQGMAVDSRSDVFSLGVILYEMLARERPFAAEHAAAALYSIVHENPQPLRDRNPDVPPELAAIVERALVKDPRGRFADGSEIESALRLSAQSLEISRLSSGNIAAFKAARRTRIGWAVAGVTAILIGLAGAALGLIPAVISPQTETAQASLSTVAVMRFENLSEADDPDRLGDIIAELLTTDLSGSSYVTVVSSQLLFDLMRKESPERAAADRATDLRVARRAGADRMLTGSLSRLGGRTIITAQIVDCESGDVLGSERVDGDDVFAMIDNLSIRIKRRLGLTDVEAAAGDMPVAEATTSDPEAYRAYVSGMDHYHALEWQEAHEEFDRALARDSGFALAYLRKGVAYFSDGQQARGFQTMAQARHHMERTTGCDRLIFKAMVVEWCGNLDMKAAMKTLKQATVEFPTQKEAPFWVANFSLGENQFDSAIHYSQKALALDPDYPFALLTETVALIEQQRYSEARRVAEHFRQVRPEDALPYELLGDIWRKKGNLDSARVYYMQTVTVAPDSRDGYREMARIHMLQGRPDSAIAWSERMLKQDNPFTRVVALRNIASIHKAWGRFDEALKYYKWSDALCDSAELRNQRAVTHNSIASLYFDADHLDEAVRYAQATAEFDTINPSGLYFEAYMQAIRGNKERAQFLVDSLNAKWTGRFEDFFLQSATHTIAAHEAVLSGRYQVAIQEFLEGRRLRRDSTDARIYLGEAYLLAGQIDDAVRELEANRREAEIEWISGEYLRGLYLLAQAYQADGRQQDAVTTLERLLAFWGEADWNVPWMLNAKRLYGSLTAQ